MTEILKTFPTYTALPYANNFKLLLSNICQLETSCTLELQKIRTVLLMVATLVPDYMTALLH